MEFSLVDRLAAGGVGRVNVGLKSNSRRLRRPDGGEEIDGEFVVAGGDPWKCSSGGSNSWTSSRKRLKPVATGMRLARLRASDHPLGRQKVHFTRSFPYLIPSGNARCLRVAIAATPVSQKFPIFR